MHFTSHLMAMWRVVHIGVKLDSKVRCYSLISFTQFYYRKLWFHIWLGWDLIINCPQIYRSNLWRHEQISLWLESAYSRSDWLMAKPTVTSPSRPPSEIHSSLNHKKQVMKHNYLFSLQKKNKTKHNTPRSTVTSWLRQETADPHRSPTEIPPG